MGYFGASEVSIRQSVWSSPRSVPVCMPLGVCDRPRPRPFGCPVLSAVARGACASKRRYLHVRGPDKTFGWHRCIATGLDGLAVTPPSVRIRRLEHGEAAAAAAADEWWPLTSLRRLPRLRQGADADAVVRAVGDPVEVERIASDTASWQLGVIASVDWICKSSFLDHEPAALSSEHVIALKVRVVIPAFAPGQGEPAAGEQEGGDGGSLGGAWPLASEWESEWVPMASSRLRHCDVIGCVPRNLHGPLHAFAALLKSS